ncbi:MAG: hypothetical protein V1793_01805 [Pseudomonadota bacterium]
MTIYREHNCITLFSLPHILIVTISISALILLVGDSFSSIYALTGGVILTLALMVFTRVSVDARIKLDPILLLILCVALFFRVAPYHYVMGGQDQGLYVNMSAHYERFGSTFVKDTVREKLNPEAKRYYDAFCHYYRNLNQKLKGDYPKLNLRGLNSSNGGMTNLKHGLRYAFHQSGIFIKNLQDSEYVFQFYPLHPIWMAIAGKLLGDGSRVYSQVLFSLLTLVFFYLIAWELSEGNRTPARIIALFLALNPFHVFFSKFPVSEVTALYFSSGGFYFLVKYYRGSRTGEVQPLYLLLSAGMFCCLFFTRISAFMYLAFFYALLISAVPAGVISNDDAVRKHLLFFCSAVFFCYGISVLYGLTYSFPYSDFIFKKAFLKVFGKHWKIGLPVMAAVSVSVLLAAVKVNGSINRERLEQYGFKFRKIASDSVFLLLLVILFVTIARNLYLFFSIANSEFFNLLLGIILISLSPVGFALLIVCLKAIKKRRERLLDWLVYFLIPFWFVHVALFKKKEYYWDVRYLVTEVIPYSLLLISFYLSDLLRKKTLIRRTSYCCIFLISAYFLCLSSFQLQKNEGQGIGEALERISGQLKSNDLLFVNFSEEYFLTPLSVYHNLNVCYLEKPEDLARSSMSSFRDRFDNLYMLSFQPVSNSLLSLMDTFVCEWGIYSHNSMIPLDFSKHRRTFYFYRIKPFSTETGMIIPDRTSQMAEDKQNGWPKKNERITGINYKVKNSDYYILVETRGKNPCNNDLENPGMMLQVNGQNQSLNRRNENSFYFKLDRTISVINDMAVFIPELNPKENPLNETGRKCDTELEYIRVLQARKIEGNTIRPEELPDESENFYPDNNWTNGQGIVEGIYYEVRPGDRYIVLTAKGPHPVSDAVKDLDLQLIVNSSAMAYEKKTMNSYYFILSKDIDIISEIRIISKTFVPKNIGMNLDTRELGVTVDSISFSGE